MQEAEMPVESMSEDDKKLNDKIDFASVMAVAVHDMKNSLSLLLHTIEELHTKIPTTESKSQEYIVDLHYEASRMNTTLVQVLSLYRSGLDALPLHVDECFIFDLAEELVESNKTYTKQKDIDVNIKLDEELSWYMDKDLLFLLMNDVLVNAMRYGAKSIDIRAEIKDEFLCLTVEDDGHGYPQSMLDMSAAAMDTLCISEGRTGLGLYFARMIALAHKNKNRQGSIQLSNNSVTGGSIFTVLLP